MRKYTFCFLLSCILLFSSSVSFAQKGADSRFYWGGNLGLMFGTYTLVDISPLVGYKVTERFHVGAGLTYTYYKYHEDGAYNGSGGAADGFTYTSQIYGGRLFTRFYVLPNLFLHAEDEMINLDLPDEDLYKVQVVSLHREWLNSVLVGGGYGYAFSGDGPALSIMVLFRLNHDFEDFYPYQNPILRIGLGFGF